MQAEHGQVFVVAASHFIFLRRQPSHALITIGAHVRQLYGWQTATTRGAHTLQPLVPIVLIYEDVIYSHDVRTTRLGCAGTVSESELFWVSLGGWYVGGTNENEFTCALCGSSLRAAPGSFDDMAASATARSIDRLAG